MNNNTKTSNSRGNTPNSFTGNNQQRQSISEALPPLVLVDEHGNLKEVVLTSMAKKQAEKFVDNKLSTSQLRAFFNEFKAIKNRLDEEGKNFSSIYPMILMIDSKIAYRASKGTNKDKEKMLEFKKFINQGIAYIMEENKKGKGFEAFTDFLMYFEAVVGYSYGLGLRD